MDALRSDRLLAKQLKVSWDSFFSRFGRLTDVQRLAIPPILKGEDLLVTAATASGKTEAACAPLIERYFGTTAPWTILYISPTRALVNDLYERLRFPIERLGLSLVRRTGEHKSGATGDCHVLLTTPESLDSLLCRGRTASGHRLSRIHAVVLDEIHLLHGNPRGEQVAWLLSRLQRLLRFSREKGWSNHDRFQRVALSATVGSPDAIISRYMPGAELVGIPGSRAIEVIGNSIHKELEPVLKEHLSNSDDQKILVFCNARKRVDQMTMLLRSSLHELGFVVEAHHGSLAQKLREENEKKIKLAEKMVLCATSTLEIGVDIGDIDLVVLDGPAPDVSAFLQRIGRGKRRTSLTRVMLVGKTPKDRLLLESTLHCARQGLLFSEKRGECYAVGGQQLASYIFQAPKQVRSMQTLKQFLRDERPLLDKAGLVESWVQEGYLKQNNEEVYLGEVWTEQAQSGGIHSNIEAPRGLTAVDEKTGMKLATNLQVDGRGQLGLAGKKLDIRGHEGRKVIVQQSALTLPDANWKYITSPRGFTPFDLPLTVRAYLGFAPGDWPVVFSGSQVCVFHLSGPQVALILRLCLDLVPEVKATNEYFITVDRAAKPASLATLEADTILRRIPLELDHLEHKLGRPFANELLPESLRMAELESWLRIEESLTLIKRSDWCFPELKVERKLQELVG